MSPSFRHLCAGLIAGGTLLLVATSASAGNVNWTVSIGMPAPVVYAAPPPAPVVYATPVYAYPPTTAVYVSGGPHYQHARHYPHGGYYRHGHKYPHGRYGH